MMNKELNYARSLGILCFVGVLLCQASVVSIVGAGSFKLAELYSAVFNMAAVIGGFVFAIYSVLASSQGEFVSALRTHRTKTFKTLKRLFFETIVVSFVLVVFTLPFIALGSKPSLDSFVSVLIFASWLALTVYLCACLFLTIFVFALIDANN